METVNGKASTEVSLATLGMGEQLLEESGVADTKAFKFLKEQKVVIDSNAAEQIKQRIVQLTELLEAKPDMVAEACEHQRKVDINKAVKIAFKQKDKMGDVSSKAVDEITLNVILDSYKAANPAMTKLCEDPEVSELLKDMLAITLKSVRMQVSEAQ